MEKIGDIELYTHEEMLDTVLGKTGTAARDEYEEQMEEFLVGETIRQERQRQNLTQQQLGERIGVKRAQISRIESGRNITLSTLRRVLRALGITATLRLDGEHTVSLC